MSIAYKKRYQQYFLFTLPLRAIATPFVHNIIASEPSFQHTLLQNSSISFSRVSICLPVAFPVVSQETPSHQTLEITSPTVYQSYIAIKSFHHPLTQFLHLPALALTRNKKWQTPPEAHTHHSALPVQSRNMPTVGVPVGVAHYRYPKHCSTFPHPRQT